MDPMVVIYLCLMVIFLIVTAIILHDKMIDRREKKQSRVLATSPYQDSEGYQISLLQLVINNLQKIPNDASFAEIKSTLDNAVLRAIPENILRRAMDVFGDEETVAEWLTSKIVALGGNTPIDTLARKNGEEDVLMLLMRIEHGVIS